MCFTRDLITVAQAKRICLPHAKINLPVRLKFFLNDDRKWSPSIFCYTFLTSATIFPVITSILEKEEGKSIKVVPVDLPFHFTVQQWVTWILFGSKRFKINVGVLKKISGLSFGGRVKSHFLLSESNSSICHTFSWNVTIFLSSQTYGWLTFLNPYLLNSLR